MKKEHYEHLEKLFLQLVSKIRCQFSHAEYEEVLEYFNAGEYGLALKTCIAIYRDERIIMPLDVRRLCEQLALKMGLNPSELLSKKVTFGD